MKPLTFPHFQEVPALPSSAGYLSKWGTLHSHLDVPLTFPCSKSLRRVDVQPWNRDTNLFVTYTRDLDDVWQSPAVTVARRSGDCEDYAILKYAALLQSGLSEDHLRLVIGHIAAQVPQGHAWCAAYLDDDWWVLDNKFHQMIHPSEYINWWPAVALWSDQLTCYGRITILNRELQV